MRQTDLFAPTLRRPPTAAEAENAVWLARGGYIRARENDFASLPLLEYLRQRLGEIWQERLLQHKAQPLHNANARLLAESDIRSWRHLPRIFWQETPEDGAPRLAAGLLGSNALPAWRIDLLQPAEETSPLPADLLADLSLPPLQTARTPDGESGFFLHPLGKEQIVRCPHCGYAADLRTARRQPDFPAAETPLSLEKVHTPGCHTIAELCEYLRIPPSKTAKVVFVTARIDGRETLVFAVLRGDMTLSEDKLRRALGAETLRPATHAEIRAQGAEPGYASPVGLPNVLTVADEHIPRCANLVAGANQRDLHLLNVNYERDFQAARVADIVQVSAQDPCPQCGNPLEIHPAVPLYDYLPPQALEAAYTDAQGKPHPIWHSRLTLHTASILGALTEANHDADGLQWPPRLAPFDVHLIWLPGRQIDTRAPAEKYYQELQAAGFRVLFDDREERPGVKFKDADLIGIPLRITLGERALQKDAAEIKCRRSGDRQEIPLQELIPALRTICHES